MTGESLPPPPDLSMHALLFIGGLHRSGTSLVHDLIREHPQVSGFTDTGVPKDEGQHLQSLMRSAHDYGGPGRFAFNPDSHLTEATPVSATDRDLLVRSWSSHWDLQSPVLVEKSPPNLIRSRFLTRLFPNARLLFVVRHPIPVSLATLKWSKTTPLELLLHWHVAHKTLLLDLVHVHDRAMVIRYEDLVSNQGRQLGRIWDWLSMEPCATASPVSDRNENYFRRWEDEFRRSGDWGIQLAGLLQVGGSPGSCSAGAVEARWVPAVSGWDGSDSLRLGIEDEVAVAHRPVVDSELEDPVEDHAAAG